MFRKRGAPVFLELMRDGKPQTAGVRAPQPPRPAPVAPAPLFERDKMSERGPRTVAVETKPAAIAAPTAPVVTTTASSLERRGRELLGPGMSPWVLVAAGIGIFVVAWAIAYPLGHQSGQNKEELKKGKWAATLEDPLQQPANPMAPQTPKTGETRQTPAPSTGAVEVPRTKPAPPPATATAKLEIGLNYLVVATLRRSDADDAAAYLAANGMPVAVVIDPAASDANNVRWQVVVLKGYAGDEFRRMYSERVKLETDVQALGRKWKAEKRKAPTDFSQVFWRKIQG